MLKGLILKHSLKNAVSYGGKASEGAVLGRVLAENPNLRSKVDEVRKEVSKICSTVNRMSLTEQEAKLLSIAPELLTENKAEVRVALPDIPDAEKGNVVMRFEPSPSGALHLGHAITFLLNAEYCKKYNGKLLLRIADTNPIEIYEPAYKLIEEEARWLTNYPFSTKNQSDSLKNYYKYAEQLIMNGKAYVCLCSQQSFKKLIERRKACPHRSLSVTQQLKAWQKMHEKKGYKEGKAVLRIKTDLKAKNPALREWPAFRIVDAKHPKHGSKYRVWPLMNFSVAIDDHLQGMTHVIRGKDHVVNTERQIFIYEYMKWKKPHYIHIGRVNFSNMKLSATQTREAIKRRKYSGWDDIRLPFIAALRKRGIQAEAFARYAIEIGPSKVDKTLKIEEFMQKIYDKNRKIIDSKAERYFFIQQPTKIKIEGAPKLDAKLPLHPEKNKGYRTLKTSDTFYLDKGDMKQIKGGKVYRLMHLFNFVKEKGKLKFHSKELRPELKAKLIHWLPADARQTARVTVKMPDGKSLKGIAESVAVRVKTGEVIQFERFGFVCRQKDGFWFGHR